MLIKSFLSTMGKPEGRLFSERVLNELKGYDWPGNVRELRNYVERSVVLDTAPPPKQSGLQPKFREPEPDAPPTDSQNPLSIPTPDVPFRAAKEAVVEAFERSYIGPLLERCNGNVSKAARVARMDRTYLHQLAQKYGFRAAKGE